MSLCDAQSVPVCPRFPFLRALSHLPGVFPLFMLRLTQHHVYPKQHCNSRLFELTTGPPYTSENSHPQKTSLHITHHPLFKLKAVCPASCWQNLTATKPGHSGVKWEELQSRMPQIFVFLTPSSTALHFPKFHATGLWSVSRVLKWLL